MALVLEGGVKSLVFAAEDDGDRARESSVIVPSGGGWVDANKGDPLLSKELGRPVKAVPDEGDVEGAAHGGSEDRGSEADALLFGDNDGVDSSGLSGPEDRAQVHRVLDPVKEEDGDVSLVTHEDVLKGANGGELDERDDPLMTTRLGEGIKASLGNDFCGDVPLPGDEDDLLYLWVLFGAPGHKDPLWFSDLEGFFNGVTSFNL